MTGFMALPAAIRAAIYMMGAVVSFTLMAISGRAIDTGLDTFEIMTYRSLFGIIIVLGCGYGAGTLHQINARQWRLHLVRNLFHFTGQNLWFYAILYIPLSQLFAFEFSTPLWVALMAPLVLAERLTMTRGLAAILGFVGIIMVARPDFSDLNPAIMAAACCAIGFAGATTFTKLLTRTDSITCILFWLTVLQAVFGLVCAGYDGDIAVPQGAQIFWVILIGVCGLLAHFCITRALQSAPATVVQPLEFVRLPVVAFVGYLLYSEPLELAVFAGAAVILAANILNLRAEVISTSRSEV